MVVLVGRCPSRTLASFVPATSSLRRVHFLKFSARRDHHCSTAYILIRAGPESSISRSLSLVRQVGTFMRSFAHSFSILELLGHVMSWSTFSFHIRVTQRESLRLSSPTPQDEVKSAAPYSRVPKRSKSLPKTLWFRSRSNKLRYHARTRDWTGLFLHLSHDRCKPADMQQLQRRLFAVVHCA